MHRGRNTAGVMKEKGIFLMLWASFILFLFCICPSTYSRGINTAVTVITDKRCSFCVISHTENYLRKVFPKVNFSILDYRSAKAEKLIRKCGIKSLPAFLLPGAVKKDSSFSSVKRYVIKENGCLLLSRSLSGEFMFLDRKKIPSRIDIFFSPYDRNLANVLKTLNKFCKDKKIKLNVHLISEAERSSLIVSAQREEIERLLAVSMIYPSKFWSYLMKRVSNINNTFWIDDMESAGIDYKNIKSLVHSGKVKDAMKESNIFSRKLGIKNGIAMLVGNKMIFRVYSIKKGNLEKIVEYMRHMRQ